MSRLINQHLLMPVTSLPFSEAPEHKSIAWSERLHRVLQIVLIIYILCVTQISHSQNLTRSESLLGGFEVINEKTRWPETIELPPLWSQGFLDLAKKTRDTNLEQAACLSVDADFQGGGDPTAALLEYQKLLDNESSLPTAKFRSESERLRKIIEGVDSPKGAQIPVWKIGARQGGSTMSVHVTSDINFCSGSVRGIVHTHPTSRKADNLSETDLVSILLKPKATFSAITNRIGSTCLAFTGRDFQSKAYSDTFRISTQTTLGYQYGATFRPASGGGLTERSLRLRQTQATVLKKFNGSMYCGDAPTTLKLVEPLLDNEASSPEAMVLLIKSLTIIAKRFYHTNLAEIDFPFTPEFDSKFIDYWSKSVKAVGFTSEASSVDALNEARQGKFEYFAYLTLLLHQNKDFKFKPSLASNAVISPDYRSEEVQAKTKIHYFVMDNADKFEVKLVSYKNINEMLVENDKLTHSTIASWTREGWSMVWPELGRFKHVDIARNRAFHGEGKRDDIGRLTPHGTVEYETSKVKFLGRFEDGQLKSVIDNRIFDKRSNQWISATDYINRYPGEGY